MQNSGNIFTSVIKKRERRSNFNLSHDVKLSLDMGNLTPVFIADTLPGDKFNIRTSTLLRMAPLISPVMHRIDVFLEYFFVPNRILWSNWETFITGSKNGKQVATIDNPAFPVIQPFQNANFLNGNGTLADYFGIPSETDFPATELPSDAWRISALPFAAYQKIWDEYYRDQNLMESLYDILEATPNAMNDYDKLPDGEQLAVVQQQLGSMRPRSWEHDYFTSALPWAQKGEIVTIPVDTAELSIAFDDTQDSGNPTRIRNVSPGDLPAPTNGAQGELSYRRDPFFPDRGHTGAGMTDMTQRDIMIDNTNRLSITSTGTGGGLTIADLRAAIKLQEWLETNARGGSRYFESIYAHFGVKSPDARLNRPEYIGSSRSNMVISEVLQTSSPQADTDTPQGNMSGHGQQVGSSKNFSYYCQEHGYILGLLSIMPKTAYQQGIPKHFLKYGDKLEFYFPEFAHLGEQEILNVELYAGGTIGSSNSTFGYIPRYSEYKFIQSRVCGDFRSTLQFWHMGRIFENTPSLNGTFIASNPTKRIFAVQDLPQDSETPTSESVRNFHSIYAHVFHDVKASRLMPKYGTPITGGIS